MPVARFALVPFCVVLMTASSALAQTAADAQSSQPTLEIQGEWALLDSRDRSGWFPQGGLDQQADAARRWVGHSPSPQHKPDAFL